MTGGCARGDRRRHASEEDVLVAVRRLSGGGVDHAFEVVGKPATILQAWGVLRPGGTAVAVGVVPRGTEISLPGEELLAEKGLRGCYYGSGDPAAALAELASLAAAGEVDVTGVVSHVTHLDGVEEAFARLRRGEGARTIAVLDADLAGVAEARTAGRAPAPA